MQLGLTGLRSRPRRRLEKDAVTCCELAAFGCSSSVEKTLNRRESLLIERGNSQGERFDVGVKFAVFYRAIDHSVSFGHGGIEIIGAEDNLDRPGSSNEPRQPFNGSATWDKTHAELRLPEDGSLRARKAEIAGQNKLVSDAPCATRHLGDADDGGSCEPQDEVGPWAVAGGAFIAAGLFRTRSVVMREEEIRIRALKDDDLERLLLLDQRY